MKPPLHGVRSLAVADLAEACHFGGWVFFDRGVIDAAAALQHLTGESLLARSPQSIDFMSGYFLHLLGPKST
jgi:predicted ATPase